MSDFSDLADELMQPTQVNCPQCGEIFKKMPGRPSLVQLRDHIRKDHPRPKEAT